MHVFPTRGFSPLYKLGTDGFKVLETICLNLRSQIHELDTKDLMIEEEGKCYLPDYLDSMYTNDEKNKFTEVQDSNNRLSVKYYPVQSAFLIEHENTVYGHIPEDVFRQNIISAYKKYLEKHANLSSDLFHQVDWDLFGESIGKLNLAKLIPILKFVNNEWCTGVKLK